MSSRDALISLGILRFLTLRQKERQKQRARKTRAYLKMTKAIKTDFYRLKIMRMDETSFFKLLGLVRPILQSQNELVDDNDLLEQLLITIKYLATGCPLEELIHGNNFTELQISEIIPKTCKAIKKALKQYTKFPSEEKEWLDIAESFEKKWNFSHCAGAYSARHIAIDKPDNDAPKYLNHKDFYSVILVGLVNAFYEFTYFEVGFYGGYDAGHVYTATTFFENMIEESMNLPCSSVLPGTDVTVPYVFVSDVYYLIENLMRTYSSENISFEEKIFNYRLMRAKRVADNAFGILYQRFGVLHQNIYKGEEIANDVGTACCALHNFLINTNENYIDSESLDIEDEKNVRFKSASWRKKMDDSMVWSDTHPLLPVPQGPEKFHDSRGKIVRENFTKYFNHEGKLPFQEQIVNVVPELKLSLSMNN